MILATNMQGWGVAMMAIAAVWYLGLLFRRSVKGGGGCCSGSGCAPPSKGADQLPKTPPTQMVEADRLAYRARELKKQQDKRPTASG